MANVVPVKLSTDMLAHTPMSTETGDKVPAVYIPISSESDNILGVDSNGDLYVPSGSTATPVRWNAVLTTGPALAATPVLIPFTAAGVNGGVVFDAGTSTFTTPADTGTYLVFVSMRVSVTGWSVGTTYSGNMGQYVRVLTAAGATSDTPIDVYPINITASASIGMPSRVSSAVIPLVISGGSTVSLVATNTTALNTSTQDIRFYAWKMPI